MSSSRSMPLLLVGFVSFWMLSSSHRSLPEGVTCGSQFSNASTALTIPNPKISWASYRIITCDAPITWWRGDADAGQMLSFTAGVPALPRFNATRLGIVVIGPGFPSLTTSQKSRVPSSILAVMEANGQGGVLVESPEDQSTCAHVMSPTMRASVAVKGGRCNFHEEYGDSNSWTLIDNNVTTVSAGIHHFAMYTIDDTTAKVWFACCDWPEDFATRFAIPEADCPYCGTEASFGSWSNLFYEQRDMAAYGGFPALTSCSTNRTRPHPSKDQCPSTQDSRPKQSTKCQLGCSQGTCHSHNIFGECTYEMAWITPSPKLGNANVSKLILFVNETVFFTSAGHYFPHNLVEMKSEQSLEACDFTGKSEVGNVGELRVGKAVKFAKAGMYYYSCEITNHCSYGQKLTVEVKDVSEGTRCHAHAEREAAAANLQCPAGTVKAHLIGNQAYGASSGECSELCTTENAIKWMAGAAQGSCAGAGFDDIVKTVQVQPAGSPAKIDVTVMGKAGSCAQGTVVAHIIASAMYGAEGDQCSQLCTTTAALQWMAGAKQGSCTVAGYPEMIKEMEVQPSGSPAKMQVKIMAKATQCHCHSYEHIKCSSDGDALYDEHIDEITQYCKGVVSGTDVECPYKCFQPFEILHIHYLECSLRNPHPLYQQIANASVNCHKAAPADSVDACSNTTGSTAAIGNQFNGAAFLGATTVTTSVALGSKIIKITMEVKGVSHSELILNATLLASFKEKVKEAIAAQAGSVILPKHISLTLSYGSVIIDAKITPPASVDATSLLTSLKGSSSQLETAVGNSIKSIPGISSVSNGTITVQASDMSLSQPEADNSLSSHAHTYSILTLPVLAILVSRLWL